MSNLVSYSFYRTQMRAAADLTAAETTAAVHMIGLPFGIDPKLLIAVMVKSTGETSTSTTGLYQFMGSADGTTFFDLGAVESTLNSDPGTGVTYVPDFCSMYYRLNLLGTYSTSFDGLQVQGVVAAQGYRVDGS